MKGGLFVHVWCSVFHLFLKMLKVFVFAFTFGNSMQWVSASASTHGRNRDLNSLFNTTVLSCLSDLDFCFFKCFWLKGATVFLQPGGIQHTNALSTHFARWSHSQEDSWCDKIIPQAFVFLRVLGDGAWGVRMPETQSQPSWGFRSSGEMGMKRKSLKYSLASAEGPSWAERWAALNSVASRILV